MSYPKPSGFLELQRSIIRGWGFTEFKQNLIMKGQVCQLLLSLIVACEELNSPELKYNNLGNYKLNCRFEMQLKSMKIKLSTITNSAASKILSYLCHVTSLKSFYRPL